MYWPFRDYYLHYTQPSLRNLAHQAQQALAYAVFLLATRPPTTLPYSYSIYGSLTPLRELGAFTSRSAPFTSLFWDKKLPFIRSTGNSNPTAHPATSAFNGNAASACSKYAAPRMSEMAAPELPVRSVPRAGADARLEGRPPPALSRPGGEKIR
jgi:hypothetical protein